MDKEAELQSMAEEIDRHLRELRRALRKPVETEFARGQLTGPQRSVMQILFHSSGLSLKELSRQVGLGHATVSGIVDRLEERGMAERQRDENDGRMTRVVVSKLVRDYMRNTLPKIAIHPLLEALRRATPEEREAIRNGLSALRRVVGEG